ncbi:MAG: spondin domain-containing protein [Gemmatimonadota bacterium]|nr:spondin domain-containing protein [Gemmatimonadota bacterium]
MRNARTIGSIFVAGAVAVTAACSTDTMSVDGLEAEAGIQNRNGGASVARTYEVTVYNLTGGQPFTPPLVATHQGAADLFDVGSPASVGVQQIAENGNLGPMLSALGASDHVSDIVVAVAGEPPPVMAGGSVTFEIDAEPGARFLSFISMLICTNDGFTGVDRLKLPSQVGRSVTRSLAAYDAGTEVNTEDFSDLVPPCPALTGIQNPPPGTGMSDPALAENGVIHHHPGIAGTAGLQPGLHGWTNPVAMVAVTRIN